MSTKISYALSLFLLISSSQAAFNNDLEEFLTPWMDAAATTWPLVKLILDEVWFLQKEIIGMEPKLLSGMYQDADQKLISIEGNLKTEQSRSCIQGLRFVLKISTGKFQTDGSCFKVQQDKIEQIVVPLFFALFPTVPTPQCPVPLLCKFDLLSLNGVKNFRDIASALKDVHKHVINLIKFIVYFKKDVSACRNQADSYKSLSSTIQKLAPMCEKL